MGVGKRAYNELKKLTLLARPHGATETTLMIAGSNEDKRSARSFIEKLKENHIPIKENAELREIPKEYRMMNLLNPNVLLTEVMALHLLKGESLLFKDAGTASHLKSAFEKIQKAMPDDVVEKLEKIQEVFLPVKKLVKDYSGKGEIIHTLVHAMAHRKVCRVRYMAFQDEKTKEYAIHPLHLFPYRGGIYLLIHLPGPDVIRMQAVERLQEVHLLEETFSYPQDFDPSAHFEKTFGIVADRPVKARVWLSPRQSGMIKAEKRFNKQNKMIRFLEENEEGTIMEIDTLGRSELKNWILSMGKDAMALAPEDLRQEIIASLQNSLNPVVSGSA
ncbi:putative DNA-binding transcriptional regulator YafY [Desulfobotulus alkaliphilus]|uniref:Putative DNA-binding transcriptional regulator YafY n=1 Tax=Desulfobotulus alkaliphilus TaxID=622671 RepID=A0A562R2U6_9BACT|nr:WYL domain-containing protein [Desulfobotulus alkaliphilus]TWI63405.1 putative DNA-binding transcriptional regulator YafY [Desulfobotulus alkaliphilus]